jgi:phosphoribosylamine--glycine ligase
MINKEFGEAGNRVVVEECLVGEEASFIAFTDGKTILPLPSSQDHKAIFDGDKGPNTGGMGAYSPAPLVDRILHRRIMDEVMIPTVRAMAAEGRPYKGFLYAGLMIDRGRLRVLEFNARLGDPEAQPLLMRLKSDLVPLMLAAVEGRLEDCRIEIDDRATVCVVMAAEGYPGPYKKGIPIAGLDKAGRMKDVMVFHAGTARKNDAIVTNGGRVLGVTALGQTVKEAIRRAYLAVDKISWKGEQHRSDIGQKALARLEAPPRVGILMGSDSDLPVMDAAASVLKAFDVPYEMTIASAHRSPERAAEFARSAADRKLQVLIAGAGHAAHLAGVIAAHTTLPVIGVPIDSSALSGLDALLSTVQMPPGIPVATMAVGKPGARNAGLLAVQMMALSDPRLAGDLIAYKEEMALEVDRKAAGINRV